MQFAVGRQMRQRIKRLPEYQQQQSSENRDCLQIPLPGQLSVLLDGVAFSSRGGFCLLFLFERFHRILG